ncbi:MAG: hypothetical protein K1X57_03975 [Gemmataceae bacterium]|nr:hypothetical protein [Gemmataceae bacterium]
MLCRRWIALCIVCLVAGPAAAQVVAPPAPAKYDIDVRYRIRAARNERIRQFLEMSSALEAAGLVRGPVDPDEVTNPDAERIHGTIASGNVARVLSDPHVRSVLVSPTGFELPADNASVSVRLTLAGGLPLTRQQLLHGQTSEHLRRLGFVEKTGYDHRNFTRLLGSVPASNLNSLVGDVRWVPGGWLVSDARPVTFPEPLRSIDPVRITEVLAESLPIVADAPAPKVEAGMEKLSADLRALLQGEGAAGKPTRLEVVLYDPMRAAHPAWRAWLGSAGAVQIEGQLGPVVSVLAPAGMATEAAKLPQVASVRLPATSSEGLPAGNVTPVDALGLSNLSALPARGQGVTVAVIDSDFSGLKSAGLRGQLIDFTAERNAAIMPEPIAEGRVGRGTMAALALQRAAPTASLVLIRVDGSAAHQVISAARYMAGEAYRTDAMTVRHGELLLDNERLRQSRDTINAERKALSEDFTADEKTQARRLDLQKRLADQQAEETRYEKRLGRFIALEEAMMKLSRVQVVACGLNWNTGFAVDGSGPMAAYLDGNAKLQDRGRGKGPLTWLQSAGDTQGQNWAGPWWDADGNGVLEFAPRNFPLPAGKWSRELNFLGWQPHDGAWSPEIPAGATVRVTLQWTEAHDTNAPVDAGRWRTPLNDLRPVVLQQRDPSGSRTSSDDLVVVARAEPLAQLIDRTVAGATYEQTIEFTAKQPGRFAVRMEGKRAGSTVPEGVPITKGAIQTGEVYPRVHVEVVDGVSRKVGRPVFADFRSVAGGTATPADARSVVMVGAANAEGRAQPYSARGSAPSIALINRPTVLTWDQFQFDSGPARGTAVANGFAAGTVAAMLSAGAPASSDLKWLQIPASGVLRIPPAWLQQLQQTTGLRERAAYLPSPVGRVNPYNR